MDIIYPVVHAISAILTARLAMVESQHSAQDAIRITFWMLPLIAHEHL